MSLKENVFSEDYIVHSQNSWIHGNMVKPESFSRKVNEKAKILAAEI